MWSGSPFMFAQCHRDWEHNSCNISSCVVESDGLEFFTFVGSEFLTSSLSATKNLFSHKKHNLIHDLSKFFEGATTRMPLDRMPYGLLITASAFLQDTWPSNLAWKPIMLCGWKPCLLSLSISGHVFTGRPAWQYEIRETEEAFQSHGNLAEVDIDGSALQESLLNWNEEICDDFWGCRSKPLQHVYNFTWYNCMLYMYFHYKQLGS